MTQQAEVTALLDQAGVTVNGPNPWDPQISNPNRGTAVCRRRWENGEAYMDGWWDVEDMAEFFNRVISARIEPTDH